MEVSSRKHPRAVPEASVPLQIRLVEEQEGPSLNSFGTTFDECLSPKRTASLSARQMLQLAAGKSPGSPTASGGRRRPKAWHAQTVLVLVFIALLMYVFARPPREDPDVAEGRAFPTRYYRANDIRERQIRGGTPRLDGKAMPLAKSQEHVKTASDVQLFDSRPARVALEGTATGRAFLAEAVGRAFETALGSSARSRETNILTPEKVLRAFQVSGIQRKPSLSSSDAGLRLPAEQLGTSSGQRLPQAAGRSAKPAERALIELPAATNAQARTMAAADPGAQPTPDPAAALLAQPVELRPGEREAALGAGSDPAAEPDGRQLREPLLPPRNSGAAVEASRDILADAGALQELFRSRDHEEFVDFELESAAAGLHPDVDTAASGLLAAEHVADAGSKSLLDLFLHGTENAKGFHGVYNVDGPGETLAAGPATGWLTASASGEGALSSAATPAGGSTELPLEQDIEEVQPVAGPVAADQQQLQRARLRGSSSSDTSTPDRSEAASHGTVEETTSQT